MNTEQKDERSVFVTALKLRDPVERTAYLNNTCGNDTVLLARVQALLKVHDEVGGFLEAPPFDPDLTLEQTCLAETIGTVIGRYKLLEKIGEGGMARVYMAEQQKPIRRKVALKIIKLGMDTKSVIARFEAERQALAMMDHPNIAKVLDAGATETGRPYFVMELVVGVPITEYCDKNNMSTKRRLYLFIQACSAIHHAHQKGIIHRDIKPSNVMVTLYDGEPVPKVIDFGIAKAINQRLTEKTLFTRYARMIGTPAYMSPEQAEMGGLDIDIRTDVFSTGTLLYELLTGTTPFDSEYLLNKGYEEMQRIIREEEPNRPSTKISTLGETLIDVAKHRRASPDALQKLMRADIDWIVMKSLEKDRNRRYDSISEFAADIKRFLNNEPVLAGPPSTLYRMKKFVGRRRALVTATIAVTVTLIIGFTVSTYLYIKVRNSLNTINRLETKVEADRKLSKTQRLYSEGRYQAALQEIEANLLIGAADEKTQLLYAQILFDMGRVKEAEVQLQPLVEAELEIAGAAHYLLARINLSKDTPKSQEHRQQAESLLPQTADAYAIRALTANTPDVAIHWLTKALQLDPSHYASRKARALVYYGLRDYTKMQLDVEAIIVMRPNDSLGYALRALAKRESGDLEGALLNHNQAIGLCEVESELPTLHEQRQETFYRMGDYTAALRDARRCVALAPETLAYRAMLGMILFKLEQYEAAKEEFDRIRTGQGAVPQSIRAMVRYALETAGANEPLEIPTSIIQEWPFFYMPHYVDLYREIEMKASRLVRGAFNVSSWSPDGKQLAYTRSEFCGWSDNALDMSGPAGAVRSRGIEILDLESYNTRVLVTSGSAPSWSPDGRFIAFVRSPGFLRESEEEVWLIPAEGGEPRHLVDGGSPLWTNNPTRLYFHSRVHEALCCIDVNSSMPEPIQIASCPGWYPHVSPDEKYLAYAIVGELTVVELSSGKELVKWIVPGWDRYCLVRWSPDGREISLGIMGRQAPHSGLWILNLERREGWHILDGPAMSCNWSRDRSRAAIDLVFPVCEIWLAQIDPNLPMWEALGPAQTRADYLRNNWRKCVGWTPWSSSEHRMRVLRNLTAVGVNQYESGHFEEALWTLQHVADVCQAEGFPPDSKANAHISIILERLGQRQRPDSLSPAREYGIKKEGKNHNEPK